MGLLFRQLYDARSSTYTYLVADEVTRKAVLIDGVFEQFTRDIALVRELELDLVYTLETHVHADHVTSAWLFKDALRTRIVSAMAGGAQGVDLAVKHDDVIPFGGRSLSVRATPGHTNGCVTYVTDDCAMAFTGDALLIRGAGRTDFQQGDARTLYRSVHEQIFTLPASCLLFPGHDYLGRTVTTVDEEKRLNPRLGGDRSESDFIGFMSNLGLPHPKQIDVAVPANLVSGRPSREGEPSAKRVAWGPVIRSFAGIPQIEAEWLEEHLDEVWVLDVRESVELAGELGHIRGSKHIPLDQLRSRLEELPKDRPIVVVCRSGGRSGQASMILESAGFDEVANLRDGMLRWRTLDLPVEHASTETGHDTR